MKISIIIPAHNEEGSIAETINKIEESLKIDYEIGVVNDHSSDGTVGLVQDLSKKFANIRLVENQKDGCFGNALKTGFESAVGDFVLPVMADLCDDVLTIQKMYLKCKDGYDVVCGSRYSKGGKKIGGPVLKSLFSWFYGLSLKILIGIPTRDVANAFKMYNRKMVNSFDLRSRGFEISVEIPLKAYFKGYKIAEVPTIWLDRKEGKSKFNMARVGGNYFKLFFWAIKKKFNG